MLIIAAVSGIFALAAPAAAWEMHSAQHIGAEVAIDQHHHHDSIGAEILVDDANDDHSSPDGDTDHGHDHLPSMAAGMSATLDCSPVLNVLEHIDIQHSVKTGVPPPENSVSLPKQPPRFA